ncbi:MAG: hypothetical protein KA230_04215 [Flavobacteriales bacterium]|nr:hypothetical protein [Flavobacteriales bacterium]
MLNLVASTRLTGGRLSLNGNDLAEGQGEDAEMLRALYTAVGLDYPKFHKMDMYARLALLASEPLYRMLRADGADIKNAVGLITLNRSGSAATDVEHWEPVRRGETASPAVFVYTLPNTGAGEITIRHGAFGSSICLVSERPDCDLLLTIADDMITTQGMTHVIVGWSDIFAAPFANGPSTTLFAGFALIGHGAGTPLTPTGLQAILTQH